LSAEVHVDAVFAFEIGVIFLRCECNPSVFWWLDDATLKFCF